MRDITVDKAELLEKLQANKESHQAQFEEAWEGYCALARKELEERLAAARDKKPFKIYWELSVPENHTDDYQRAIEMLAWHQNDTIQLSEREFRQYIDDIWDWTGKFTADNASYSSIIR